MGPDMRLCKNPLRVIESMKESCEITGGDPIHVV